VRTVELLPDERLDAAIQGTWRRLALAGLPSLAGHRHPTNRPHLTVAEAEALPDAELAAVGRDVAAALPLEVSVVALGAFVRRGLVLHLVVVPSPELVALHSRVWQRLVAAGAAPRERLAPGRWAPHVILASRLARADLSAAAALVADQLPLQGAWVAARSYDDEVRDVIALS
jgi:hypothetical protein